MQKSRELAVGTALANEFFQVVPARYETYCSLVSRICQEVFRRFSIAANLVPCQLWHAGPDSNHVIGFIGKVPDDQWDGHVVCMTETLLLDAAVRGLRRSFSLQVPSVVLAARFTTPSQALARTDIDGNRRLWWFNAPYGFDHTPPLQPVDMIERYASEIASRVTRRLSTASSARFGAARGGAMEVDGRAASF